MIINEDGSIIVETKDNKISQGARWVPGTRHLSFKFVKQVCQFDIYRIVNNYEYGNDKIGHYCALRPDGWWSSIKPTIEEAIMSLSQ